MQTLILKERQRGEEIASLLMMMMMMMMMMMERFRRIFLEGMGVKSRKFILWGKLSKDVYYLAQEHHLHLLYPKQKKSVGYVMKNQRKRPIQPLDTNFILL